MVLRPLGMIFYLNNEGLARNRRYRLRYRRFAAIVDVMFIMVMNGNQVKSILFGENGLIRLMPQEVR